MRRTIRRFLVPGLACALGLAPVFVTPSAAAAPAGSVTLRCDSAVGTSNAIVRGYSVVLGRVVLPTGRVLGTRTTGARDPGAKLFAKSGLLVKPGKAFDLVVPDAWKGRMSIGWGAPDRRTWHLRVPKCPAPGNGARWIAFAGGFYVGKPSCVPLRVRSGSANRTVHIGVGKRCPA